MSFVIFHFSHFLSYQTKDIMFFLAIPALDESLADVNMSPSMIHLIKSAPTSASDADVLIPICVLMHKRAAS